ncbi:hypothetical protein [Clostridium sp. B9]|uniref:hypothetical protein n=1 Tax=Clostridium sp. B9 TaxID=3423224 RepID=UPI003D2EC593
MKKKLTYDIYFEIIFYLLLAGYLIYSLVNKDMILLYSTALTFITLVLPRIITKIFKITLSPFLNSMIIGFIFISMFLAKMNNFYAIPHWDTFLHVLSGILTFVLGYMIFLCLNDYKTDNVKPILIVVFALIFGIACTALWETWEFFTDQTFGLTAQISLFDTMKDIITGSIFPIVLSPVLNSYLKGKSNKLFQELTDFMKNNNRRK